MSDNTETIEVVKFQTYTYVKGALASFAERQEDGTMKPNEAPFFNRAVVLVPKEDGGPRYEPLTDKEAGAIAKLAEKHPEAGVITRRAHFKNALLVFGDRGVSRFQSPNELVLYISDEEPVPTDGPHPDKLLIDAGFGKGTFHDTEKIAMNPETAAISLAIAGSGLLGMSPNDMKTLMGMMKALAGLTGNGRHGSKENPFIMDDADDPDAEAAIVAKTVFTGGKFGLVNEGGSGMEVFGKLVIMHEPGAKPEIRQLTDEERDGFREASKGKFVPTVAYTFEGGYMSNVAGGHLLQVGTLPVMVEDEGSLRIDEGFLWAPKEPFDKLGVTNYLGVKKGPPTKAEQEAAERMTSNTRYHEGVTGTVN